MLAPFNCNDDQFDQPAAFLNQTTKHDFPNNNTAETGGSSVVIAWRYSHSMSADAGGSTGQQPPHHVEAEGEQQVHNPSCCSLMRLISLLMCMGLATTASSCSSAGEQSNTSLLAQICPAPGGSEPTILAGEPSNDVWGAPERGSQSLQGGHKAQVSPGCHHDCVGVVASWLGSCALWPALMV